MAAKSPTQTTLRATFAVAILFALLPQLTIQLHAQDNAAANALVKLDSLTTLSTNGSTRATAYAMSNKIISANGKVFVGWLDHVSDIQLKAYDVQYGSWGKTVLLGKGADNHSGPAMTMDSAGHFHVVYGTHHHAFKYRRSTNPNSIDEWDKVSTFGAKGTYPSLICDANDTLYCTYRSSSTNPWRLIFQRKEKGGLWTAPKALVDASVKGYSQFGNPLAISKDGKLHLAFHIYDSQEPKAGKRVGYVYSADRGDTWKSADNQPLTLPITPASPCFVEAGPDLDMRVGNIVTDSNGQPWFSTVHLESSPRTVKLWRHHGQKWISIDLQKQLSRQLSDRELVSATITFDADDNLFCACTIEKVLARDETYWGHPSQEIVLMTSSDQGKNFSVLPISKPDANLPNWLPSIERPYSEKSIATPSLMFTHGGPGQGTKGGKATEVIFVRLSKQ